MGGEMVYLSSLAAGVSPLSLADPFRGGIRLDNRRNKKVKKEYSDQYPNFIRFIQVFRPASWPASQIPCRSGEFERNVDRG